MSGRGRQQGGVRSRQLAKAVWRWRNGRELFEFGLRQFKSTRGDIFIGSLRNVRDNCACFVGMLVHWGMRPTDLYKLRWGSIEGFPWSEPLESMTEPEELIAAPNQISMLRAEEVRVYAEGKKSPRRSRDR